MCFQKTTAVIVLSFFATACSESTPSQLNEEQPPLVSAPSEALEKLSGFAGEYVIVDARMASGVAAPMEPGRQVPIGESIRFGVGTIEMSGASCDDWRVVPSDSPVIYADSDPNLIDLTLAPTDSPITSGDQRENRGFVVECEGEHVFELHKVDDRVLVMPTANSSINLILERPLTSLQVRKYQMQLKSMKFYDGPLSGKLDEATLRASRVWYEDRARLDDDQPVPARPAITENLLDALMVLADKKPE